MSETQRRARLAALVHLLDDMVEHARAGRNSAVALRDSTTDETNGEQERIDLDETARACAAFGNQVRLSLIKLKSYLPDSMPPAAHEPISP